MASRRLKFWGWGYEDAGPTPEQVERLAEGLRGRFGLQQVRIDPPPRVEELSLRPPRVAPPERC